MERRILFNIASRSRPTKFIKLVAYIQSYVKEPYSILAKIDSDDDRLHDYLHIAGIYYAIGKSENKIHAINRDIPKTGWDILVDISDDFVFTDPNFADIIREHCGPNDILKFPEPYADGQSKSNSGKEIIIMAVMGNEYYNRFGYIYNPAYKSLYCDNELTEVARRKGRLKVVNIPIFYHAHPAAGYGTKDAQTVYTESFNQEDKRTYLKRLGEGFP